MIINYSRDGAEFDRDLLEDRGFKFHSNDFRKKNIRDSNTGESTDEYEYVFNFVGFLVNEENDVFSVFPKNFLVKDINKDSSKLFNVISKHTQRRPDLYLGNEYGKGIKVTILLHHFLGYMITIYDLDYILKILNILNQTLVERLIGKKQFDCLKNLFQVVRLLCYQYIMKKIFLFVSFNRMYDFCN